MGLNKLHDTSIKVSVLNEKQHCTVSGWVNYLPSQNPKLDFTLIPNYNDRILYLLP
jgi:hypothetical protein